MSGNVSEWVCDLYRNYGGSGDHCHPGSYGDCRADDWVNGVGSNETGYYRVVRGGDVNNREVFVRVAQRCCGFDPGSHGDSLGFRLVQSADP